MMTFSARLPASAYDAPLRPALPLEADCAVQVRRAQQVWRSGSCLK